MSNPSCCSDKTPESKIRDKVVAALIFLFAFIIRLVYLNQIKTNPFFYPTVGGLDPFFYDEWARQINSGNWLGKEVFYGLPLYPYFLSMVYRIFGYNVYVAKFLQLLIGAFSCGLIYYIAKIVFNKTVGVFSALMAAVYGTFIFCDELLLPSFLTIFLNSIAILILLQISKKPTGKKCLLAGIILGLSALTMASSLLFAISILVWLLFFFKEEARKKIILYIVSFLLGLFLVIFPVTLRNYIVGRDIVLITSHAGINFYIGNNPDALGTFNTPPAMRGTLKGIEEDSKKIAEENTYKELKSSEVSRFWLKRGIRFIKREPLKYGQLLLRKIILFWNGYEIPDVQDYYFFKRFSGLLRLPLLTFGVIAPIGIVGIILCFRQREKEKVILLYLFVLTHLISLLLFFVNSRYRLPVVPFLIIFAGYTIYWCFEKIRRRKFRYLYYAFALILFFFIIMNRGVMPQNFAISHFNLGKIYQQKGSINQAINEYEKVLSMNYENLEVHCNLGALYEQKGWYDKAITEYKEALKLNPHSAELHYNLGTVYGRKGWYDEALSEYEQALKIKPDYAEIYSNLGIIYRKEANYEQAIASYKKALRLKPDYGLAHFGIAQVYEEIRESDLAAEHWQKAVKFLDIGSIWYKEAKKHLKR